MSNGQGNPALSQPEYDDMTMYYTSMYPPVVNEVYPHVISVADEMDDPNMPMLPRERFDAMTDRIMSRVDGAQMSQFPAFGFDHRRRDFARGLIAALLIAELLRRRRHRRR